MNRSILNIVLFAMVVLLQDVAHANTLSNSDFSTAAAPTTLTAVRTGAPSAAPPWTVYNNSPATTKTEVLPSFGRRSGVIHVTTTGAANGLVQVWAPYNQGPSQITHGASIWVNSGKVGIGTGNGGNTFLTSFTSGTGRWEEVKGTNGVCPANETIIYSVDGPADFYVDAASVEIVSNDPCPYVLSSGLFGLPGNAASVDWAVINNSKLPQTFKVTVYKSGVGAIKTPLPPGTITLSLEPGKVAHNANSVGTNNLFVPGFYYEVVVETTTLSVMPTVEIWEDHGGKVIPGATILPSSFMDINGRQIR